MSPEEYQRARVTIDKEELSKLAAANYHGNIVVIDKPEQVDDAIKTLRRSSIIGFDTETRPSFRKGVQYKVALIQLATTDSCYLFRTNLIGYPKELIDLLEDPKILKVGLSIHDDFHNLKKVAEIEPEGFIDLQTFVKDFKIADNSLSRVYAILFGKRICKGQRLSNWEQGDLTEAQQMYAALDAYACIRIYEYLIGNNFDPKSSKYLTLPPVEEPEEEK